eukprot:7289034-Alexandrium_andersonii.AAC.1
MPDGPKGPVPRLRISGSRRLTPRASVLGVGSAMLRAAPPALGSAQWVPPTSPDSEPRRGAFGRFGVLG